MLEGEEKKELGGVKELKKFRQVSPETGLSFDYVNEFEKINPLDADFWEKSVKVRLEKMRGEGVTKLVATYEELFPPTEYDYRGVEGSEDIRKRINELNAVAGEINRLFVSGQYSREDMFRLLVKGNAIIAGENSPRQKELAGRLEKEFGKQRPK